ncbi:hypothetical protein M0R45_027463 [Rubus argutus]|uniref:Uncharacterized protein n=1 Tax=Rubus argutus TaxID=59490 RepID=A0AAW1X290_RUBAR
MAPIKFQPIPMSPLPLTTLQFQSNTAPPVQPITHNHQQHSKSQFQIRPANKQKSQQSSLIDQPHAHRHLRQARAGFTVSLPSLPLISITVSSLNSKLPVPNP